MNKRLIPAVATALALTSMLGAVGGLTAQAASAPKHTAAPVQISFWYGLGGSLGQVVQGMVSKFNATHPGIHITATYQGSYSGGGPEQQKLIASIKAGDPPNVAQMEVHSMPVFAAAGRLLPLGSLMMKSAVDKPSNFLPGMLASTQYKGTYYGVPFNRSVPLLMYNETMFQKAGIKTPPNTWAQVVADAKRLTHGSGKSKIYGFEPLVDWWPWEAAVWSGGGQILSPNLSQAVFATPAATRVLTMEQNLVKEGYATVQTGPQYWTLTTQAFIHGQVAMDIDSAASIGEVDQGIAGKFAWGTAMFPMDVTRAVPPGGGDAVIMQGTPANKVAAAWTFIQWWTAPAQTIQWSEMTGYVPVQKSALSDPAFKAYLKAHPQHVTALNELQYQHAAPASGQYLAVVQYVQKALEGVFDLGQPVMATMKTAEQQANSQLSGGY